MTADPALAANTEVVRRFRSAPSEKGKYQGIASNFASSRCFFAVVEDNFTDKRRKLDQRNAGHVLDRWLGFESVVQRHGWIIFCPSACNRKAEHLPHPLFDPAANVQSAPFFDQSNHRKNFWRLDLSNRAMPDDRKNVTLHSSQHASGMGGVDASFPIRMTFSCGRLETLFSLRYGDHRLGV